MAEATERRKRAAVVVLGDIGRSPRMQYHSLSLDNQGCTRTVSPACCAQLIASAVAKIISIGHGKILE
ncbi:unnamed protein product [Miscanthus lutarioriparius]|uniref:Uncharacterized protein n=1 Tax=Miscanthus lutarioriparius TaxID=422564 RepID=A0A811QCR0_9POAL|nr:unnamed protein product [Miscanthus lutarioriparius]